MLVCSLGDVRQQGGMRLLQQLENQTRQTQVPLIDLIFIIPLFPSYTSCRNNWRRSYV
ncbi:unnamed protein product [Linum tenue]|uniref:Uncharacterized protein n=1 Tax=Linum tenue TaxID=586396 RepID=A0AAV0H4I4_9ROSI|nr:unnamed protein product [Linum tenue]